ncbi:hypothetical protein [Nocardioides sp. Leaf285]|uniref:hypothetical protein n=1 Tax=Nocardioides sp. Leaf285 TaxID=1736322 RepID=UPI00070348AF|nr:hypothetical protein [Nocardioides sp. Leaf285]KQP66862.1 hypothetical protein ASF47_03890 [Nocardioides sp. Leaf285]
MSHGTALPSTPAAEPRVDPVVLWLRAGLLATVTLFLGAAGHVTADGLLPGPVVMTLLTAVTLVLSAALLARPASTLRLVTLLVGGQAAVHVVLSATAGHVGDAPTTATPAGGAAQAASASLPQVDGRRVGSLLDAYTGPAGDLASGPSLTLGHLVEDLAAHAPMMAAHLLAAALVGLWLAVGEHALWALVALAGAVLAAPWRLLAAWARTRSLPAPARGRLVPTSHHPAPVVAHLARSVVRRGPPALLA